MIEFAKKDFKKQVIPEKSGIFIFSGEDEILFNGITTNLKTKINFFLTKNPEDKTLFQIISLTKIVSYKETKTIFDAFIEQKKISEIPEYNRIIKPYENYVYLGIDFRKPPFFKATQDTQDDLYYLGPFTDRFFLYDLLDTMGILFQFPTCKDENFPCSRVKNKKCYGYCTKDPVEIFQVIRNSYLQPDDDLIKKIEKEHDDLSNELQFTKADVIKKQLEIIKKFYDLLKFFHVTKNLSIEFPEKEKSFKTENGMLSEIIENNRSGFIDRPEIEYRENEFLAFDKIQFPERWIIYQHLKKNERKIIDKIFKRSILKMKEKLEISE
ncbi:MAG: hypothetical protein K8R49_03810 [Candidatus Cloacimonetes bacterium]|nr:hypothetical protein [Candidatus Cloacimonadota bacterium]